MNRYNSKSAVNIGDNIVFDNSLGEKDDIPKIRYTGEVVEILKGSNVKIKTHIPGKKGETEILIPYYILK